MYSHASVAVILTNVLVLLSAGGEGGAEPAIENIINAWGLFAGVLVGSFSLQSNMHELQRHTKHTYSVLNKHMMFACFSLCANTFIFCYICPIIAHCYMLHTIVSVGLHIVCDNDAPHHTRSIMVVYCFGVLCSIYMFPTPLTLSSISLLYKQTPIDFTSPTFEIAHIWAFVLSNCTMTAAYVITAFTPNLNG